MNIPSQQEHAYARALEKDILAHVRQQAEQREHPHAFGVYQIDQMKEGDIFIARAVVFPIVQNTGKTVEVSVVLAEGRSEESRLAAVEDLAKSVGMESKEEQGEERSPERTSG